MRYVPGALGAVLAAVGAGLLFGLGAGLLVAGALLLLVDRRMP